MDILYNEVHVIWREDIQHWCARSVIGDYGISTNRTRVVNIAIDAAVTSRRYKKIVVHKKDGSIEITLTNFKGRKPSSQFFQDAVP